MRRVRRTGTTAKKMAAKVSNAKGHLGVPRAFGTGGVPHSWPEVPCRRVLADSTIMCENTSTRTALTPILTRPEGNDRNRHHPDRP